MQRQGAYLKHRGRQGICGGLRQREGMQRSSMAACLAVECVLLCLIKASPCVGTPQPAPMRSTPWPPVPLVSQGCGVDRLHLLGPSPIGLVWVVAAREPQTFGREQQGQRSGVVVPGDRCQIPSAGCQGVACSQPATHNQSQSAARAKFVVCPHTYPFLCTPNQNQRCPRRLC